MKIANLFFWSFKNRGLTFETLENSYNKKIGITFSLAPLNLSILVGIFSRGTIITSAFDLVLIRKYHNRLGEVGNFDCYSTNVNKNKG